ncbi:MAG: hypothetical protein ACOY90_10415 [Candidatus Zhuqueibacterota bacterium]
MFQAPSSRCYFIPARIELSIIFNTARLSGHSDQSAKISVPVILWRDPPVNCTVFLWHFTAISRLGKQPISK